jgi:hypothetical protein
MSTNEARTFATLAALALAACGEAPGGSPDAGSPDGGDPLTQRCLTSSEYLAFDPTHHAPQDLRLQRVEEMLAAFAAVEADVGLAAAKAAEVLGRYEEAGAALSAKVAGRKDVHFTDARRDVGAAIDEEIRASIQALGAATTALQVKIAKQRFEKRGVNRFLYLSVVQELWEPSKKHYDEAYGYLGTGQTNQEAGRRSVARIAGKRDGNNGTTLAAELFALVLEGGCKLETALASRSADQMGVDDDAAYRQVVDALDEKMRLVFAYSVGHELLELEAKKADVPAATVKLFEGEGYFRTLEPYLTAAGGAKAALATSLRTAFDAALAKHAVGDTSWAAELQATQLLGQLEAAYAIDVKG